MDIILVHGAFHGGWCWAQTAKVLTAHGARVFTPTLTGLGDRKHLFSPSINLATHVTDIVNLIEYEKLDGCVLVGHSYAGNVLAGVGDQLRDRVSHYIFVDASVPPNGSTTWGWSMLNPSRAPGMMELLEGPLTARLTPMPRSVFTETIELRNRGTEGLKRSYLAAANPWYENMAGTVKWVSKDPDWTFRTIDTGHDMMVTRPEETAELIWELANR